MIRLPNLHKVHDSFASHMHEVSNNNSSVRLQTLSRIDSQGPGHLQGWTFPSKNAFFPMQVQMYFFQKLHKNIVMDCMLTLGV